MAKDADRATAGERGIMKKFLLLLALASVIFILSGVGASAQGSINISDSSFKENYPAQMSFHLAAAGASPITTIGLAVRFPNGLVTRLQPHFTSESQVDTTLVWDLRGQTSSSVGGYLPPGAQGEYSWHIENQGGSKIDTPFQSFQLTDNRKTWKTLKNDKVILFWYDGGQNFGQAIFDKANNTLAAIQQDIGATMSHAVQIFIYGDRKEFLDVLSPGNQEWAGGTIDDTFGIVLINASSGDLDYALSTTPHELTHLVIAENLKGPYKDVAMPLWMNEGLAVYHEYIPPKNEPRFDAALRRGIQTDTLFSLRSLSSNFPADASVVEMAYGEGFSVVDFMVRTYGRDKLTQIMSLFKAGTTADDAFMKVLGVDQDGLENAWRKSVGAQVKNYAKAPTPTPGAVPTFSFSSVETPNAGKSTQTQVAQAETPFLSPNSAPTPQPTSAPGGGSGGCGVPIAAMGLLAYGAWRLGRRKP